MGGQATPEAAAALAGVKYTPTKKGQVLILQEIDTDDTQVCDRCQQ